MWSGTWSVTHNVCVVRYHYINSIFGERDDICGVGVWCVHTYITLYQQYMWTLLPTPHILLT